MVALFGYVAILVAGAAELGGFSGSGSRGCVCMGLCVALICDFPGCSGLLWGWYNIACLGDLGLGWLWACVSCGCLFDFWVSAGGC